MALSGKGLFLWRLHRCEGGSPDAIAARACAAGLSHVLLKVADGSHAYNVDLAAPVVDALKGAGLQVWGWQFVYGDEPFAEAEIALHRIRTLNLDGFVINAEEAYKRRFAQASAYVGLLRPGTDIPLALSSYRYPNYHVELPWAEFLSACDFNMPQVYWVQANNPAQQLERSIAQFQQVYPQRPIIPTGAAYEEYGWRPALDEIVQFMRQAQALGLPAINFWSWDYAGTTRGRDFWKIIADYHWPPEPAQPGLVERLAAALNAADLDALQALYLPGATLVTARRVYQGQAEIRGYYEALLQRELPAARLTFEQRAAVGTVRHISWEARDSQGLRVRDGQDSLVIQSGRIQYHSRIYWIDAI